MKRKPEVNLALIQNFILFMTHSGEHGLDSGFKEIQEWTPEQMYETAKNYIAEDHVDGYDTDEEVCIDVFKKYLVAMKEGDDMKGFHILKKFTEMRDHDYIDKEYLDKYTHYLSNKKE